MAGKTQIGTFHQEEFGQLLLVGAVALGAFARHHWGMLALSAPHLLLQFRMALEAEHSLFLNDHTAVIARVGIMARKTLLVLEGRMDGPSGACLC